MSSGPVPLSGCSAGDLLDQAFSYGGPDIEFPPPALEGDDPDDTYDPDEETP